MTKNDEVKSASLPGAFDVRLGDEPSPEHVNLVQSVHQQWNSGNQAGAIEPLQQVANTEHP
jgi:hypothetical protein